MLHTLFMNFPFIQLFASNIDKRRMKMMRRIFNFIVLIILSYLALGSNVFCAAEEFIITLGEDITFTSFNLHKCDVWYEEGFDPHEDIPRGDASSFGSTATASGTASSVVGIVANIQGDSPMLANVTVRYNYSVTRTSELEEPGGAEIFSFKSVCRNEDWIYPLDECGSPPAQMGLVMGTMFDIVGGICNYWNRIPQDERRIVYGSLVDYGSFACMACGPSPLIPCKYSQMISAISYPEFMVPCESAEQIGNSTHSDIVTLFPDSTLIIAYYAGSHPNGEAEITLGSISICFGGQCQDLTLNIYNTTDVTADAPTSADEVDAIVCDGTESATLVAKVKDADDDLIDDPNDYYIKFELEGEGGLNGHEGVVTYLADLTQVDDNLFEAKCTYKSPQNFSPELKEDQTVKATLFKKSGAVIVASVSKELDLHPSPIVLVHGLWANSKMWHETQNQIRSTYVDNYVKDSLRDSWILPVDYSTTAGDNFGINTMILKSQIEGYIKNLKSKHVALSQVDVIGHSMGGILARRFAGLVDYKNPDNFDKGYFHKLITMNTPHKGAYVADLLVMLKDGSLDPRKRIAIELFFNFIGKPINQGAIDELSTSKCNLGFTRDVPGHAIVGDVIGSTVSVDLCDLPINQMASFPLNEICKILKLFRVEFPLPDTLEHDLIVEGYSQRGGLTGSNLSIFENDSKPVDMRYWHCDIYNQPDVNNKLIQLLFTDPTESIFFGNFN